MGNLDKEIRVIAVKGEKGTDGQDGQDGQNGQDGKSSYELAVEEELFSGTLEEWIETFATPENYITRTEFQKVTQAQYDAMAEAGTLVANCYYLIIDDTTATEFEDMQTDVADIKADTIINNAKHLWRHNLVISGNYTLSSNTYTFIIIATLYTLDNTPITSTNIFNYFNGGLYGTNYDYITCNGRMTSNNKNYSIYSVGINPNLSNVKIFYCNGETTTSTATNLNFDLSSASNVQFEDYNPFQIF